MYYIGIDVGGTNIKAGLIKDNGEIVFRRTVPTGAAREGAAVAEEIGKIAAAVAVESGVPLSEIDSIGIGIPGACDEKNGTVLYTANIDFMKFPLREAVQKHIPLPVHLANDANCAALGEYVALPDPPSDMLFVTLGTGIGGGIIIGGKIYEGAYGIAGEVGHIRLCPEGRLCGCGRHGCWEMYASVTALVRDTREFIEKNPASALAASVEGDLSRASGKTSFVLAKEGDADAKKIVDTWISYVAEGITDLVNTFNPSLVLIGGAISREGETILSPVRDKVYRDMYKSYVPFPEIRAAKLGNDAGLIGAAFLGKK